MARSAIVVVVEAAESVVAELRLEHDPMAVLGVPAHITIVVPFRPVVDAATADQVAAIAAEVAPFEVTFARTERFPGTVLYLTPEPVAAFRDLIERFVRAFPDCPPYGGEFPDPVPHLTIGIDLDVATADGLAAVVAEQLPFSSMVDELTLLVENDEGFWSAATTWSLGG